MKYLAKSAEVLNEADRFQKILDWELFTSQQDIQLNHSHIEGVEWRPGDPLYGDPSSCHCQFCMEFLNSESGPMDTLNYMGHHVRPMFELINDQEMFFPTICCDVWWDRYTEEDCWVCGAEFPLLERAEPKPLGKLMRPLWQADFSSPALVFLGGNDSNEQIGCVINVETIGGGGGGRGIRVDMQINDEWQQQMLTYIRGMQEGYRRASVSLNRAFGRMRDFQVALFGDSIWEGWPAPQQPFYAPRGRSFHNPWVEEPHPLRRPNVRGPMWGTAVLFDPREGPLNTWETNRMYGQIPPNWRAMRVEFPLPEPLVLPRLEERAPRTGPPTTLNRRQREIP